MKTLRVEDFDQDRSFKLRMEAALRKSAMKIREQSKVPDKFDSYIEERAKIIRDIAGPDVELTYEGNVIFP